jgi:dCMP deaminase
MRDLPLLILGLTGPMGAGCTRLARDISKMEPGKVIKKRGLLDVVSRDIAELSRRMRELQPSVQSSGVQKQSDYMGLKRLNRSLAEKLAERACLNVIAKSALPEPVYISITTIILKLAAESITTPEFQEWAKDHAKAADLLKWLRGKWESELTLYDSWEHDASRFSHEELSRMDGMFADFENTGDSMTLEQLESFFGKRKNEFYLRDFGENIRLTGNPFNSRNGHDPVAYASESLVRIAYESDRFIRYYRTRSDEKKSQFFIIDEIKNPGEAEFFRARHQHFYLISIYSNSELRAARLRKTLSDKVTFSDSEFSHLFRELDSRDWGFEDFDAQGLHRQNIYRCFNLADIAINNDIEDERFSEMLFDKFIRYYALMLSPGCVQPTVQETYMNTAYSLSLRSTCISRQVGAVITDNENRILSLGWNEVPEGQIGCGLKIKSDYTAKENRLFEMEIWEHVISGDDLAVWADNDSVCVKDILSRIEIKSKLKSTDLTPEQRNEVARGLRIKRLEYSRSLHAEENAILQVASRGGVGLKDGVIYVTTFPCELCSKKIYQVGISKIYYTEPYPNSISEKVILKDGIRSIKILQFEGVKSYSYFKLFKPEFDKKDAQMLEGRGM